MDLPEEIELTLLLSGGQQFTLSLPEDDLLLQQLFEVLVDATGKKRRLFQIPIHKGRSLLTFRSEQLVAIVTDPPVLVESGAASPSLENPGIAPPIISYYVQIDQFLDAKDHQRLLKFVLQQEKNFVSTSTSTGDLDYRKSIVLYAFPEFSQLINQKIQAVFPEVLKHLDLPPFEIQQIEAQLTGHNDGNYYKVHNDSGSPDTATRELTYVYYFNREPKAFSGGELRIYDTQVKNNYYTQAETFHTIEPRNNSIVFFLSRYMHEVMPIACPSRAFADSRFTINGWVRR
jgi:SM-20-related protein